MNLRDRLSYLNTRQKILFSVTFILVLIFIVLLIIVAFRQKEKPVEVVEEPKDVIEIVEPEPTPTEEPIIVEQSKVINCIVGSVKEIIDLGSKVQINVLLVNSDTKEDSNVIATLNTECYNLELNEKFIPTELEIGDKIVIYASGDYKKTTVNADVILKSEDTSYNFGKLKSIQQDKDGTQLWYLYDTNDKLYVVPSNVRMIDGYTGLTGDISEILIDGSMVLFKYAPNFEITENGNIYTCVDIIVLSY